MRLTREARQQWRENWDEARKAKDARRTANRAAWSQRRDWSDDNEHRLEVEVEDTGDPGESRSLTRLRAIMGNPDVPLFRRLDAGEVILAYELAPGAAAGADPEQVAAASYRFLNAVVNDPETPEALRFRALKSVAAVENARAAQKNSVISDSRKRELLSHLANSTRIAQLRRQGSWRAALEDGEAWVVHLENDAWPSGWPGGWSWPPTSFAAALERGDADAFKAELRLLAETASAKPPWKD